MIVRERTRLGARTGRQGALRTLIGGAGRAGRVVARDLRHAPEFGLAPIGFLDDGHRRAVAGLRVLGSLDDLARVAEERDVDVVVLAIPGLPPQRIRELAATAASAGVRVRYLPTFLAAIERDARLEDLRDLQLDQLLGRSERRVVRRSSRSVVEDKTVIVTGAGGSIGSELCRQIKAFGPKDLFLLDHDESNLHTLQMELEGKGLLDGHDVIIADIRDAGRIDQLFGEIRPDVVFHAAAHKHLPLLELHPCEGVKTNVLGTKIVADAAIRANAQIFVGISTDKAADPRSVLGATKRLAELLLGRYPASPTTFSSVRFGNVLGSRGSLLSVLGEQIRTGGVVTITHPDVSRFFMTIEEAAGLVIEAAGMAESGRTFVLDMGEPIEIVELVHRYADLLHVSEDDFTIEYTGLRPGEKLTEDLFGRAEEVISTPHPKIWATGSDRGADLDRRLDELFRVAAANDGPEVRRMLQELVPEYVPVASQDDVPALAAPYPDGF
jgi:FlaA1/EpsC-like NDP-sugar epimerase